jgi:hypothetical protein
MKLEELLRHVADNVEAGKDAGDGLIFAGDPSRVTLARHIAWDEPYEYALAPKTRMINGFEVPAPVRDGSAFGYMQQYFHVDLSGKDLFATSYWVDDWIDNLRLHRGLVFTDNRSASANGKALIGIDPYAEVDK